MTNGYKEWNELVAYIESLPGSRSPSCLLSFRRVDDFRRKAMRKNGSPIITHQCHCTLTAKPSMTDDQLQWEHINGWGTTPEAAVQEAHRKLKKFVDETSGAAKVQPPPEGTQLGFDLV